MINRYEIYYNAPFKVGNEEFRASQISSMSVSTISGKKFTFTEIEPIRLKADYLNELEDFFNEVSIDLTYSEHGKNWVVRDPRNNYHTTTVKYKHEFEMLMFLITGIWPEDYGN